MLFLNNFNKNDSIKNFAPGYLNMRTITYLVIPLTNPTYIFLKKISF